MSNQVEVTRKYVQDLTPSALLADKNIQNHITAKFCSIFQVEEKTALAFYEREKDNFIKRVSESGELKQCTTMSVFMSLAQVFGWKLSLEGGSQSDVYLIPGNVNVGTKDNPVWEKQMIAQPSPYGEKKIRIETGQVKQVSSPVIVYEEDKYDEFTDDKGKLQVEWNKAKHTSKSIIIGSFIRLELPDGSHEFKTFDLTDINRWKSASDKKNKGKGANPLYTSNNGQIDPGFLEGKTLKHAFKLYPRVVSAPKLPETFKADPEFVERTGLDMSEFTEDATHTDVTNENTATSNETEENAKDEFDAALEAETASEPTVQYAATNDDNEPQF